MKNYFAVLFMLPFVIISCSKHMSPAAITDAQKIYDLERMDGYMASGTLSAYRIYYHDAAGNTINEKTYTAAGALTGSHPMSYNISGSIIYEEFFDGSGIIQQKLSHEYNENNKVIKIIETYYSGGIEDGEAYYLYSYSGDNISKVETYYLGALYSYSEYTYLNNVLSRKDNYDSGGGLASYTTYEFDGDNITNFKTYNSLSQLVTEANYYYTEFGALEIIEAVDYSWGFPQVSYTVNEYDEKFLKIRQSNYDGYGTLQNYTTYTYIDTGKWEVK